MERRTYEHDPPQYTLSYSPCSPFTAERRAQIDELAREIERHGGKVTDAPRQYDYLPGYYAMFFTDPDGLKLALMQ